MYVNTLFGTFLKQCIKVKCRIENIQSFNVSQIFTLETKTKLKETNIEGYNENLLQDNLKLFQHNIYSFFRLGWLQISNNDSFQIFFRIFNPFSWALLSCSLSFSNFLIITTKSTSFCRNSKYAESTLNIFDYQQNFS